MGDDERGEAPGRRAEPSGLQVELPGRYRVDGLLGRGGMGAVYRVFDDQSQRPVALKVLTAGQDPLIRRQLADMFRREFRTLNALSHPSVIDVYDYGVCPTGPYYTMELLGGQDLHGLAPLDWRRACRYLRDVCSSLALLHSRRLLHRDVSPRNVRCQQEHAKLIDFGAMAAMGAGHQVVGTPPLVPPEALDRREIDGRSDLYAVGATLYWALTGRHAYPAKYLSALPRMWLRRPPAPSLLAADVPAALDALVQQLLAPEPDARPSSAAEVMERLSAIAGIELGDHVNVPMSYLATPSLVGRQRAVERVRACLRDAVRLSSRQLVVSGDEGIGRSRMLDAAVLEGRLEGVQVIRIQSSELSSGEYALGPCLLERLGSLIRNQDGPVDDDVGLARRRANLDEGARAGLVASGRALIRRVAEHMPLLVAIDDADKLDGGSQALLATLHQATRRRVLVVLTVRSEAPLEPLLEDRVRVAEQINLTALAGEDTEALLGSVFGNVPGLAAVAAGVQRVSHGNPRATLELAQHLVDHKLARYELGRWVLPLGLKDEDLPKAWTQALDERLEKLTCDGLRLAELLAFAVHYSADPEEINRLVDADPGRSLALETLVSRGVFRVEGHQYSFAAGAYAERLRERVPPARRTEVHRELALWLQAVSRDAIDVASCQLRAGDAGRAIDGLLKEIDIESRWDTAPPGYADVLTAAIEGCAALGRARRDRIKLLVELVHVGEHMGVRNMRTHFAELLAQVSSDGALDAYLALPADMAPGERLREAFANTQARYESLPEHARVYTPIEGVRMLVVTARRIAAFAAASMDYTLLKTVPDLSAFTVLSPAIDAAVRGTLPGCLHLIAGRYEQAVDSYLVTLNRLDQPDRAGLDEREALWACSALRFGLGHLHAGLGTEFALKYADELAVDKAWAVAAWDVRRNYYLRLGRSRDAERCRARMERMVLESGRRPPMVDTSARLELDVAAHAGDLPGARLAMERMASLIEIHPGYAPYRFYGPAVVEHLRGNHERAIELADRALELARPGEHPTWPWIANCVLDSLLALKRFQEARDRGREFLRDAHPVGLGVMVHHVELPTALAEAHLGDTQAAVARIDAAIAYREQLNGRGLDAGWAYEHRAKLAIFMRDTPAFLRAAERCAQEYGKGQGGSLLIARYEQLRRAARDAGMQTPSMLPEAGDTDSVDTVLSELGGKRLSELAVEEQGGVALDLLMRQTGAQAAQIYRFTPDGLRLFASRTGDYIAPDPETLLQSSASEVVSDFDTAAGVTQTDFEVDSDGESGADLDGDTDALSVQVQWCALPLGPGPDVTAFRRTGVALLGHTGLAGIAPPALVHALGRLLAEMPHSSAGRDTPTVCNTGRK